MKENFYNINIDITDKNTVLNQCKNYLSANGSHSIYFLNAHCYNIARKDPEYFRELNNADLLLNDGIGIKIASLFTKIRFRENLNGTDLIPDILNIAAEHNQGVFFLGGREGVAKMAAEKIREKIPDIRIEGYSSGYIKKGNEKKIVEKINNSGASVLIVGMGVPRQEKWIAENRAALENIKILVAGGAIIDFMSGTIKRAPLWMRKINMEWMYRLYLEPKRMWKRYLVGNVLFFYNLFSLGSGNKENQDIREKN